MTGLPYVKGDGFNQLTRHVLDDYYCVTGNTIDDVWVCLLACNINVYRLGGVINHSRTVHRESIDQSDHWSLITTEFEVNVIPIH